MSDNNQDNASETYEKINHINIYFNQNDYGMREYAIPKLQGMSEEEFTSFTDNGYNNQPFYGGDGMNRYKVVPEGQYLKLVKVE
ncbi:MAG: hypothetical protein AAB573_04535 [Patescibacteria group bacterium]